MLVPDSTRLRYSLAAFRPHPTSCRSGRRTRRPAGSGPAAARPAAAGCRDGRRNRPTSVSITGLVAPGLAWNAQTPASGITRGPSWTRVPCWTGPAFPIGSLSARATVSRAAGSAWFGAKLLQAVGLGVELVTVAPATSIGNRMWRPLALFALPAGDLDQVEAELGEHRRGDGVERKLEGGRVECRVHRPLGPLVQVTALGGADAVGGLPAGDVGERRAADDLLPGRVGPRPRRRGVGWPWSAGAGPRS